MARRLLLLVPLVLLPGCALLPGTPAIPECPGVLLPTQQIEGDFLLRQRVRLQSGDHQAALRLAVQKRGTELVLIAFDPLGAKLLSVVQRGTDTQVESLPGRVLPVAPLNLLRDLHRIRFLAGDPPSGGEGQVLASFDGTRVTEEWSGGRLLLRRFERTGAAQASAVEVHFEVGEGRIDNPECSYRATWVEISDEPLPGSAH